MRKKSAEDKQLINSNFGLVTSPPLVLFALCTGASSDPMLRVYTAMSVMEELEKATKDFIQSNVLFKKSGKVCLPKLVDRYGKETSLGFNELVAWVSANVDRKLHDMIHRYIDEQNKKAVQVIE
ncbi:hypothetical protein HPP92_022417 [Vanilla planifolia]|uniref:DUF547 domain-containing protein n=1 Tax=Vanilla planifolia TaxID=51239 RepID=A0A835PRH1_VANPL|nr:hypothetical protein HPP92_022417 [Vanilla planifolia]